MSKSCVYRVTKYNPADRDDRGIYREKPSPARGESHRRGAGNGRGDRVLRSARRRAQPQDRDGGHHTRCASVHRSSVQPTPRLPHPWNYSAEDGRCPSRQVEHARRRRGLPLAPAPGSPCSPGASILKLKVCRSPRALARRSRSGEWYRPLSERISLRRPEISRALIVHGSRYIRPPRGWLNQGIARPVRTSIGGGPRDTGSRDHADRLVEQRRDPDHGRPPGPRSAEPSPQAQTPGKRGARSPRVAPAPFLMARSSSMI